jgi:hypothetical protein
MSTTKAPPRPRTHDRPTVPPRVTGPTPAPRSSRFWLLVSIAALVVAAAVVAVLLWMAPGADTGAAELSRGDAATAARLEGKATAYQQARANEAEAARWIAQAEHYEQLRQTRSDAASTARLEGLAERELGRSRADAASTARLEGLAQRELGR